VNQLTGDPAAALSTEQEYNDLVNTVAKSTYDNVIEAVQLAATASANSKGPRSSSSYNDRVLDPSGANSESQPQQRQPYTEDMSADVLSTLKRKATRGINKLREQIDTKEPNMNQIRHVINLLTEMRKYVTSFQNHPSYSGATLASILQEATTPVIKAALHARLDVDDIFDGITDTLMEERLAGLAAAGAARQPTRFLQGNEMVRK